MKIKKSSGNITDKFLSLFNLIPLFFTLLLLLLLSLCKRIEKTDHDDFAVYNNALFIQTDNVRSLSTLLNKAVLLHSILFFIELKLIVHAILP